jgi:hypothetical protein
LPCCANALGAAATRARSEEMTTARFIDALTCNTHGDPTLGGET